jgi:hypothetical protein
VKKLVALIGTGVLGALMLAALSFGSPRSTTWSATLGASQEIPKQAVKDTSATGTFQATLSGTKLKWKLTFSKLTGPATAAHVHAGAMGKAGGVVVPLCSPCKSGQSGTATVTASVAAMAGKHGLYVNVHTMKNPNGEIRGQISSM